MLVTITKKIEEKKPKIDSRIRICICCGETNVDFYEYGISCEQCGTSLYFGRIANRQK